MNWEADGAFAAVEMGRREPSASDPLPDKEPATQAFEAKGRIGAGGQLVLENPPPITGSHRVRVFILLDNAPFESALDPDESTWLRSVSRSPAFDFLRDPRGDIYTADDGEPFDAQG